MCAVVLYLPFIRFSTVVLLTDTLSRVNKRYRPYLSPNSVEEDGNLCSLPGQNREFQGFYL